MRRALSRLRISERRGPAAREGVVRPSRDRASGSGGDASGLFLLLLAWTALTGLAFLGGGVWVGLVVWIGAPLVFLAVLAVSYNLELGRELRARRRHPAGSASDGRTFEELAKLRREWLAAGGENLGTAGGQPGEKNASAASSDADAESSPQVIHIPSPPENALPPAGSASYPQESADLLLPLEEEPSSSGLGRALDLLDRLSWAAVSHYGPDYRDADDELREATLDARAFLREHGRTR